MSLDYYSAKASEESEESALGYFSDLFALLSFVFLFLYVISTMQSSVHNVNQALKNKNVEHKYQSELTKINSAYQLQMQVYKNEVQDFGNTKAAAPQKKIYDQVMKRLSAIELKEKAEAENYQNLLQASRKKVGHIFSLKNQVEQLAQAQVIAASQIQKLKDERQHLQQDQKKQEEEQLNKKRDFKVLKKLAQVNLSKMEKRLSKVYEHREQSLNRKLKQIEEEAELQLKRQKEEALLELKQKEEAAVNQLKQRENELKLAYKKKEEKITATLTQKIDETKSQYQTRMQTESAQQQTIMLEKQAALKASFQKEQALIKAEIVNTENQLKSRQAKVTKNLRDQLEQQKRMMVAKMEQQEDLHQLELLELKNQAGTLPVTNSEYQKYQDMEQQEKWDRAQYEMQQKLAGEREKASKKMKQAHVTYEGKIAQLKNEIDKKMQALQKSHQSQLQSKGNALQNAKKGYQEQLGQLKKEKWKLQDKIALFSVPEQALVDRITSDLQQAFKENGIQSTIDPKSSEVTIRFKDAFFDFDKAVLKPAMVQMIRKFFPVFTQVIFADPTVSRRIDSIELIGFASPVYAGGFVYQDARSAFGRKALKYNMDLSYRRALSIFNYIFNPENITFEYQRTLLRKTKVISKSHLGTELQKKKNVESIENKKFCEIYACDEWHKVSIRFNFTQFK